ncbi:NAD(P)-dependent oxidoreductase [candidate division WWE3 bacterium]|uniref:dTDP-4-dehydrorhamnose reductase n=1 Tax=candidate division WWE3 bacterium TaxID=2053526 RepID=A0A7X9E6M4_UNCKA|nr:NAD(P)-dependent oxidoreductase [candidate division WWE3 bacterium]
MKVLITGSSGLVGSRYLELSLEVLTILDPTELELNITDKKAVESYIQTYKPNLIIHFAAVTDVKKSETERGNTDALTWRVNVEGTKNLVNVARTNNIRFIHISTDLVFPGTEKREEYYDENSTPEDNANKLSWYGYTKLKAEEMVKTLTQYTIIRIAYPYRAKYEKKVDFARLFLQMYDSNTMYPLFSDNTICPTFIDELCEVINIIIKTEKEGVFHVTSTNSTSHYEFAKYIIGKTGRDTNKIEAASMSEFIKTSKIPRALYSTLRNDITQRSLGIKLKTWQESANSFLYQLKTPGY